MKKFLRIFLILLITAIVTAIVVVAVTFPPVMAGMAAKMMCSCVYVMDRTPQSVRDKELQVFPGLPDAEFILASDSSVTASVFGSTKKAIFRKGLGCTLLAEQEEAIVRQRKFNLATPPSIDQDSIRWPSGNLSADSAFTNVDQHAIQKAIDEAFADVDPEKPVFTHAVLIVYKGKIIGERYAEGFNASSKLMGWSMAKSMTNAFIGVLVKEGKLRIEDPAPVPEWQNDERKNITINNLLQASSGLSWGESYFLPWSDFHVMFAKSDDKAGYAAGRPLKHEPGTLFEYSSGTTNILSRMVRQTVGDDEYYRFPYEKLFYRIGMNNTVLEVDASGTFVTSSYDYATARDWARLGLLYINDGVWNGERIFPEGWVKYSTTPGAATPMREYGAQIWLNLGDPVDSTKVFVPGLPREAYLFEGFERNAVVMVPSKDLVVVRLGVTHNQNFSLANLVNGAAAAVH